MDQVPDRVDIPRRSATGVTSGQTQRGKVQLHTDGDELVQRIRLVGGVGDHDARGQRIITGQSRDAKRLIAEEERGDDVRGVGKTTATSRVVHELVSFSASAGLTDKRVGLGDHAATVDGANLALVERLALVAVVRRVQPVGIAHEVAGHTGVGGEDVAAVDQRGAVALQAGHGIEDSRSGHRGIGSGRVGAEAGERLVGGNKRSGVTVHARARIGVRGVVTASVGVVERASTLGGGTDGTVAPEEVGTDQGVADHGVNPEGHVQTRGLGGLLERVEQVRGAEDVGQTDHLTVLRERLAQAVENKGAVVGGADCRAFTSGGEVLNTADARRSETEHRDGLVTIVLGDRSLHAELIEDRLLLDDREQLLAEVVLELELNTG